MTEQERIKLAAAMIQQALEQYGVSVDISMSARAFKGAEYEDLGGAFLVRQGDGIVLVEPVGFEITPIPNWQPPAPPEPPIA